MSTEPTLSAIASDVQRIGEQTTQITKWITGNGDPKKGLLCQVADLRASCDLLAETAARRAGGEWSRMVYDAARAALTNVITILVIGAIGLLVLGARVSFAGGPLP